MILISQLSQQNSKSINYKLQTYIMGPRQSSQTRSKYQQFFQQYEIIQQLPNENIRFLQHKQTKKQYLLRQLTYNSKQEYLKAIDTIKNKRQQLKNSDHVIPLTEYLEKQQDQYCSTFYKLYVLYEYPQRTLDDQINERTLRKNPFTETELWSILASCILGMSHLQKKGIRHGSLRSSMIFLSQQGLIKLSDPFTTGCQTNYQTLLNKRNSRHIYLSPQQTQALQGEIISPVNINVYKSDIFTLAMILLECGLLQYQDECYRDQYSRIHMETLEYNKNRFRKLYSDQLVNVLNYMSGEDPGTRPEWIQLENYVITDNTSKSFVSEGRKSNIFVPTKPVSVNIHSKKIPSTQIHQITNTKSVVSSNPISIHGRSSISQKPMSEIKPSFNPVNRGIGISTSKPTSVINYSSGAQSTNVVNRYPQNSVPIVEYRQSTKPIRVENIPTMKKPLTTTIPSYQNFQPSVPLTSLPSNIPTLPIITKPLIAQSPVKNQLLVKNLEIKPANVSNISTTRPFRSVFPNSEYVTKTKVDENLVQIDDDQQTTRSVSDLSSCNNYQNQYNKDDRNQFSATQGQFTNGNTMANTLNQTPYQQQYNNQQSVNNFTPKSNNYPTSYQPSNQNTPPPLDPASRSKASSGQFVIETFKLGSRYEGYKLNGLRHGLGKFYYQDGGMYDGNWVQNKMQGYGKLYYQSGKIAYDGQWIQDQFTGHGVLYNQNPDPLDEPFNYQNFDNVQQFWVKYEGEFLEDSKNGKGVLYLSNGEYFQGNFVNDNAQGEGVYTTMSGQRVKGLWQNNMLVKTF